ncbi:SPW repeat protein [Bradyrhizobium sp.]|uniref:SPW repeat protein n=1 Tax=Bradyrhizobium sp. TaxID=376 RepID=UPI003C4A8ED7
MNQWTNAKLCDVGNLILGAILFFTPWMFQYPAGTPWRVALVTGVVIAAISIAALAAFAVWEEWLNLVIGLWLIASPWIVHFAGSTAMRVNVVIGVLVAILAAIELIDTTRSPRPVAR